MKILFVNTEYARGGAAQIARTLHQTVDASPVHESLFAYGRGSRSPEPHAVRVAFQLEVYLHAFLTRVVGLQGYGTYLSTRRLLRLIQSWTPDVIHFHNIHGYYLDLRIAEAVGKLRIPLVWTLHDVWSLTGRCAYFFECDRWKVGCGRCSRLHSYPGTLVDSSSLMWRKKRKMLGGVWNPVIVSPSQWLGNLAFEASGRRCRVKTIPNGIDTQLFRPRDRADAREELGLPSNKKVVLLAAADLADERKGTRYFFECLRSVETGEWMVVTVGKRVDVRRMPNRQVEIKQLGYVSGSEAMARVYCAADLFCITSLDDNFPTTVLESLSCGTPVVGFRVGGIPEQVPDDCGILVKPKDAEALAGAIERLLEDDILRKKMGHRCRERAVTEYSIEMFSNLYMNLYNEITGGGE